MQKTEATNFTEKIIEWYGENQRLLPWRETGLPYRIWLSEIMLQQTRVSQGLPYYERFLKTFPTVYDLAAASEDQVLKLWQGLGYYSRARNMHSAAQTVVNKHDGIFPETYKELKELKGIGDYTASAIASICFDQPVAVLDGNVFRVLARFFGIDTPINSTEGRKQFKAKAEQYLDKKQPGTYNQALMEFGAIQCKPKNPLCFQCPLQADCVAFQQGKVEKLPVKLKKGKITTRYFNYLVIVSAAGNTVLQKRTQKGIWRNLYEFPLIETKGSISSKTLLKNEAFKSLELSFMQVENLNPKLVIHRLSHQKLMLRFWCIKVDKLVKSQFQKDTRIINFTELENYPVPVVIEKFLNTFESLRKEYSISLQNGKPIDD